MKKISARTYLAVSLLALSLIATANARIITVDDDNPADFNNIQAAIDDATDGDTVEIKPGTHTGPGNRNIDFLGKPITVRSTDPNDPEIVASTIIDCNGLARAFYFHNGEDANSILAGLTITNGYASLGAAIYLTTPRNEPENGPVECRILNCIITNNTAQNDGGGCYIGQGNPTISNCTITQNSASDGGGGIACRESNPVITDCTITQNSASDSGGGIACWESNPVITDCTITQNSAPSGGAIYSYESNPVIVDCTITENSACSGSGIYSYESNSVIANCIVAENKGSCIRIGSAGAGMYFEPGFNGGSQIITNCIMTDNTATYGGAIFLSGNGWIFSNCILAGNSSAYGGAISCNDSDGHITNCTFAGNSADTGGAILELGGDSTVTNSIFWMNRPSAIDADTGTPAITYCNIPEAFTGVGNIDLDPLFVNPGYWDLNDTPSDIEDDFWVNGDYHLKSQGWRWDTQRGVWTWDDVTSRCIDAGDPNSPLADELLTVPADPNAQWAQNVHINMGAFGGTEQASIPPLDWTILADYNNDGIANFTDFALWPHSGKYITPKSSDNSKSALNPTELALFADRWLDQTTWFGTLPPPTAAWNPSPTDGAVSISIDSFLSWAPGAGATSHDVYFGPNDPPQFQANQTEPTFYPDDLSQVTTYYWRIDEVNPHGTTPGPVWTFTTQLIKGMRCFPADTPVWVDGKLVPIIDVIPGQKVGMVDNAAEVEWLQEHGVGTYDCYDMTFETGNTLVVVHSHNFLTVAGQWVAVENLTNGSILQSLNGPIAVTSVVKRPMPFIGNAYNLKIKGANLFFVGKDGVAAVDCSKLPKE